MRYIHIWGTHTCIAEGSVGFIFRTRHRIHRGIYRQTLEVIQKAKVASVLLKSRLLEILSAGCELPVHINIWTFFFLPPDYSLQTLGALFPLAPQRTQLFIIVFLTETDNYGGYFGLKKKSVLFSDPVPLLCLWLKHLGLWFFNYADLTLVVIPYGKVRTTISVIRTFQILNR